MIAANKQTNLPGPVAFGCREHCRLSVLALGFEARDMEKLKSIFQLETRGDRSYFISSSKYPTDVVLVNHDNPAVGSEKCVVLERNPGARVVVASRGPLADPPPYHIRGALIAFRVLAVLDRIPVRVARLGPEAKPTQPTRPPFADSRWRRPVSDISYPAIEARPLNAPIAIKPAHRYRALVVDDSAVIQKSLELKLVTLREIGAVDLAGSGESALEKAATCRYDLIFMDVMMPGIDGYETCSRLRARPEYKRTPIIMVSGKTSPLDEVKGIIAGCTTYLNKPVQDDAFRKLSCRILTWLSNYQPTEKPSR